MYKINLKDNISKNIFKDVEYYWEVLNKKFLDHIDIIKSDYIYIPEKNTYISKTAKIDNMVYIGNNVLIDHDTIVRGFAYIRDNIIIGKNCLIGNSVEIKNSIIFDNCCIPHFNFVGDSILGNNVHLGAGAILSNLRLDKKNIIVKLGNNYIDSNLNMFGCIISDNCSIGCNTVINPGRIIKKNTKILPLQVI